MSQDNTLKFTKSKQIVRSGKPFYGTIRQIEGNLKMDPMLAEGIQGLITSGVQEGRSFFMYLEQAPRFICTSRIEKVTVALSGAIHIQTLNSIYVIESPELHQETEQ